MNSLHLNDSKDGLHKQKFSEDLEMDNIYDMESVSSKASRPLSKF